MLRPAVPAHRRFALNWTYLRAIAQGVSPIDLQGLALRTLADARQFVREYGIDLSLPGMPEYLRALQQEALGFVRSQFLNAAQQGLIPAEVVEPGELLELLLIASRSAQRDERSRMWACALLKVIHGLIYIDANLKLRHFESIRTQVFAGLDPLLLERDGQCWLSDGMSELPVLHMERKRNKSRHSILLKLLQKPEYVAADIHDHLGLRLVLGTRIECVLALEMLRRAHLVSVTNVEVSRTRNTLVDLEAAREVFRCWAPMLERSPGYPQELLRRMDAELDAVAPAPQQRDNPHSAAAFHSLQLTVRKMIQLPTEVDGESGSRFIFDYEIQLLDAASHAQSLQGAASHEAYKQRQVETARRRVLGPALIALLDSAGG
ncbi:TIGR04552 family protein [Inhella sp.]|uniref:TIGR04552 family protein n=1 Tax=Inhella sp. TaxID=1921806 RepID=UPI0035B3992E